MKNTHFTLLKRSGWILLMLFILVLPFMVNQRKDAPTQDKDKFKTTYVSSEDYTPDYWKADGPFGNYIREYELTQFRDRNAKHFPGKDGNVAVIYGGSIHYLDERGSWQEIDTRIRTSQVEGYAFENTRNGIKTWYPDETGESIEVGFDNEFLSIGSNMTLSWEDENGQILKQQSSTFSFPEADSNKVVYHAFFPGVDNEFEIEADKIKNKLILNKRPAAKGNYLILSEQMVLPKGWTVKLYEENSGEVYETKNTFQIVDNLGIPQLTVPAPEVYSLAEQEYREEELPAKWILDQEGQVLTLKMQVEQSWLQDPQLKYPVVLDPTLNRFGDRGGWIRGDFRTGPQNLRTQVGKTIGGDSRGWMNWNIGSIPSDSEILSVNGKFSSSGGDDGEFQIRVNQVSGDNGYGNNWNNNASAGYADLGTGPTYYSFRYLGYHFDPLDYPTDQGPISFGAQARADLQAQRRANDNRFQVGLAGVGDLGCGRMSGFCQYAEFAFDKSRLVVGYCVPFGITVSPIDQTICRNGNTVFNVAIRGSAVITNNRWQYSTDGGTNWKDLGGGGSAPAISGTNTRSLSLSNVPVSWQNYLFRYGASNPCSGGVVWSDAAKLDFTPIPSVTSHPQAANACEEGNTSFNASFNDATNYIWQQSLDGGNTWDDLSDNVNFSGVSTFELTINNVPLNFNNRQFRLRGYNDCEENFTNPASLSTTPLPNVVEHPTPVTIGQRQSATFTADLNTNTTQRWVYSEDGGTTWTELYDRGGSLPISGATTNTLTLENASMFYNGREYALRGYNGSCGPVYTNRALLTVLECIPQTATCNNISVQLDGNGQATITAEQVYSGQPNECIVSLELDKTTINCDDNSVILTLVDIFDNESACTANLNVIDQTPPVAKCKFAVVELDENGQAVAHAADFDNGSFDACGDVVFSFADGSTTMDIDCSTEFRLSLTLTITDESGNTSTCDQELSVFDTVSPSVTCRDIIVELDENGFGSYYNTSLLEEYSDNCDYMDIDKEYYEVGCQNIGTFEALLIVEDLHGSDGVCRGDVTVVDKIAPEAICQAITVQLDENGEATITAEQIDNGSSDACGIADMQLDKTTVSCNDNSVTLTVIDNNGNESHCNAEVNVVDEVSPTAICQVVTVLLDENGQATITAEQVNNNSSDNCGIAEMKLDKTTVSCDDNSVTLTVIDNYGNESSCSTEVNVVDEVPPTAICQSITVKVGENGQGILKAADFDNGSFDNCGPVSFEFPDGSLQQTVECPSGPSVNFAEVIVKDNNGNQSRCFAPFGTKDEIPPVATCKEITVELDENGNGAFVPSSLDNGSYDNCGIKPNDFLIFVDCSDVGTFSQTYIVEDWSSNQSSCEGMVTVVDRIAPDAECQDITVQLDGNGEATITPEQIDNGSSDACGIADRSLDKTTVNCGGGTVTLTVIDNNGNENSCTAKVTTQDEIPPIAKCKDVSVFLDKDGKASALPGDFDDGSFDACGGVSLSFADGSEKLDFECGNRASVSRATLNVTDENGNTSTCTQNIFIKDEIPPTANCQNITLSLSESGTVIFSSSMLDNGSFDNCDLVFGETIEITYTCQDIGTYTAELKLKDTYGNEASCKAEVTIIDDVAPDAQCQNITVQLDENGEATITPQQVDNGSSDACGIADMILDKTTVSCTDNSVTLTIIDNNGNQNACTSDVNVVDNIAPVPDIPSLPAINAECGVSDLQAPTATDNCAGTIIGTTDDLLSYDEQGTYSITWTFDDGNGNVATQTQTVIVNDVSPPVPDQPLLPIINGECSVTVTTAPTATDNCGGTITATTTDPLTYTVHGVYTIRWTFDDGNGNVATQTQTVIVNDVSPPVPDVASLPTITGECSAVIGSPPTATDNCGGTIIGQMESPPSFFGTDTETITWIYDDGHGNITKQTQTVIVRDVSPPVPDQASLPELRISCLEEIGENPPTATDACTGQVTGRLLGTVFFPSPGRYTITWTFRDGKGNRSTQEQVVIYGVEDNSFQCKDITISLDDKGEASISPQMVYDGYISDCIPLMLTLDQYDFDCTNLGDNTVTLTRVNLNGANASCTATVTVEGESNCNAGSPSNPWSFPWSSWSSLSTQQSATTQASKMQLQAFPNPFRDQLTLAFTSGQKGQLSIEVFNLQGQRVSSLFQGQLEAGEQMRKQWDGTDQGGRQLPSGMYLIRMQAGNEVVNKRVLLQR